MTLKQFIWESNFHQSLVFKKFKNDGMLFCMIHRFQ
ncbi:hypothetical protein X975_22928, partial [Stegodyphus mimosarum]